MTSSPTEQHRARHDATGGAAGSAGLRLVAAESPATWLGADAVPLGIVVIDPDGWCTDTNQGWHDLTGLSPDESQQHGWLRCLDPDDRSEMMARIGNVAADGGTQVAEHRIAVNGGAPRWTRWWVRAERADGYGRVVMAVADVQADHTDPTDTPPTPSDPSSNVPAELVDQAIRSLSQVGFDVASVASLADPPVTHRLQLALSRIDTIITQLRHITVNEPVVRVEDPG